jgi:hypothetical protein
MRPQSRSALGALRLNNAPWVSHDEGRVKQQIVVTGDDDDVSVRESAEPGEQCLLLGEAAPVSEIARENEDVVR